MVYHMSLSIQVQPIGLYNLGWIAWYQTAYLAFLTDKCQREPQFHDAEGVLKSCAVTAFVIWCVDQLRLQARESPLNQFHKKIG